MAEDEDAIISRFADQIEAYNGKVERSNEALQQVVDALAQQRPTLPVWVLAVHSVLSGVALAALGSLTAWGWQHHVTEVWATAVVAVVAVLGIWFVRLKRR